MISIEDVTKAEDEVWSAILAFANNTDPDVSPDLAENVSMSLIELTNLAYLRGREAEATYHSK